MNSWWFVVVYGGDGWRSGPGMPFETKAKAVESARGRVPPDGCVFIVSFKTDGKLLEGGERYRLEPDGGMYPLDS